jgi:hypothetical protein
MEAADAGFTKGIRYIQAAHRLQAWCGDEDTMGKLSRLAETYRFRAFELLAGKEEGTYLPRLVDELELGSFSPTDGVEG